MGQPWHILKSWYAAGAEKSNDTDLLNLSIHLTQIWGQLNSLNFMGY